MANRENNVTKLVQLEASAHDCRLIRINTGQAWTGDRIEKRKGYVIIHNPRIFRTGTPNGYSDLTGWRSITVTPSMVGKKIAVFVAAECKTSTGRATKEQLNFIDRVRDAGGIAGVVRSAKDFADLIRNSFKG